MVQKWPKRAQKGLKMGSNRPQNDAQTRPKWPQSGPKVTPDRPKNVVQNHPQNDPKMILSWSQNALYSHRYGQKGSRKGFKCGEMVQKPSWPLGFTKLHKNTQHPLRTLPDTHPVTAHFYRFKRRFWPFFISKTSVLNIRKNFVTETKSAVYSQWKTNNNS